MRANAEGLGDALFELFFDRRHRLALGEACAVAQPEDMGIDSESLGPEGAVHHDIGSLAPDARAGLSAHRGPPEPRRHVSERGFRTAQ